MVDELRPIPGWDHYLASPDGGIHSTWRGSTHRLRPGLGSSGYMQVCLCQNGFGHNRMVHVLILETFHGVRPAGCVGSHVDGDQLNNSADNLVWESQKENVHRKIMHGTHDSGTRNSRSVMDAAKLAQVWSMIAEGKTNRWIADAVSVSTTTISRIRSGRRYRE